ncbi:hypothetical protein D1164_01185 [Mariniphaga sediminis]|uniref:Uncharacterized protein n=1 Tax=Mariniphaga sediminis TaxID=1628158 RepID=A0A399D597_9BACT|nr:hypothetical protein D1164_01185 [Mariniphaga sediminis]
MFFRQSGELLKKPMEALLKAGNQSATCSFLPAKAKNQKKNLPECYITFRRLYFYGLLALFKNTNFQSHFTLTFI